MKKTIFSLAAVAALTTTAGFSAQAEEVVVDKGDTLWSLSQEHKVSVDDIKNWNNLTSDIIIADNTLKISDEEVYTVVSGDTLWSIAEKFDASVGHISEKNGLSGDIIHPGQELVIYSDADNAPEPAPAPAPEPKPEAKPEPKPEPKDQNPSVDEASASAVSENDVEGVAKEVTVTATAYTAFCEGCSGTTATGVDLRANPDKKVIAVDPNVIPLGSKVYVEGYGYATAEDTGGAIKGNRIDVFIPTQDAAIAFGKRELNVKVLN
ncbi:LysM peptidoglycan-binding domain-containing protein [Metabacillus idriensis]|uniref:3D domain-containing protein n=1 Tax=Metabacillus idriensis TaxID=324768 RepID=UPI0008A9F42C|nr:3D domain-containing protein [Metabacillus idriensis]MCM3597848.1 LysM peptidoglycan-binding domain-containing protein [Metabacillus idriensis]OHR70614.1 peptidoglycan-binding protein [Bacillus sp. HMSC76G11]